MLSPFALAINCIVIFLWGNVHLTRTAPAHFITYDFICSMSSLQKEILTNTIKVSFSRAWRHVLPPGSKKTLIVFLRIAYSSISFIRAVKGKLWQ